MKAISTLLLLVSTLLGGCAMATDLNLKWEWPADRQPAMTLVVSVSDVSEAGKGWFGIKTSPSLVEGLPDPVTIKGTVVKGNASLVNKSISITLPKIEAGDLGKGNVSAIGVLENNVCICIKKLQSADEDISNWQC